MAEKIINVSGKRKLSVARATLKSGTGIVRINKKNISQVSPELAKHKIMEPLILAGDIPKTINISVTVLGGGTLSQAEAVRNAIAKGLIEWSKSKELKKTYLDYDRHLLVSDVRRTEPQKPCRSAPRSSKQTSKR